MPVRINRMRSRLADLFDISHLSITENGTRISVFSLAFPSLLQQILLTLIGTVNTYIISDYAENAVGAISASTQLITLLSAIASMITLGSGILINIELGRGERERASRLAGAALIFTVIEAIAISLILTFLARPLLSVMRLSGDTLEYGVSYLSVYGGAIGLNITASYLTNLLLCHGKTLYTMIKSIISSVIGVALGYLFLIVDLIPAISGITALATGGVVSMAFDLSLTAILTRALKIPLKVNFSPRSALRMISIGAPASMSGISYMLAQTITTSFMARMNDNALNAKSLIGSIVQYTYFISYALSTGVRIMMGRYAGQGDVRSMKRLARSATLIAALSNTVFSVGVFIACKPLISVFTDTEAILVMAPIIFAIDIAVELLRGINHVLESSLIATRKVITTFVSSVVSCWCGSVLLSYLLGTVAGMGLVGVWIAFATDELIKAVIYIVTWSRGTWQRTSAK